MLKISTLIKQKLSTPLVLQLVFAMLVGSIFLGVKYPILSNFSYFLGEKKDFLIIFAYLSDIFLIGFIIIVAFYNICLKQAGKWYLGKKEPYLLLFLILLIIITYYINYSQLIIPIISIYILIYLTKFIVLHGTLSVGPSLFNLFKALFLFFISLESILAIYQFWNQASFGMSKIGESVLNPYTFGVAKVEAFGQVFIRSYGTFPHPNVLGAFLVIGLLTGLTAYIHTSFRFRIFLLLVIVMQIFALVLTFSRSAWLVSALSMILLVCLTWNKDLSIIERLYPLIIAIILSLVVIVGMFLPFIASRGQVSHTTAYTDRASYNLIGARMILDYPLFGVGTGQSLVHMKQYMQGEPEPWIVQPIHNYYLLFASELGLPALLVFCLYIGQLVKKSIRIYGNSQFVDYELICLLCSVAAMLILMMFDHYFYTLQSPAILFWLVLGLLGSKVYRLENMGEEPR